MNCSEAAPYLDSLIDGELLPPRLYDIETHVRDCADCTERLLFYSAVRASTRAAVHAERVPPALISRIQAALAEVRDEERQAERQPGATLSAQATDAPATSAPLGWRVISTLAAAAVFVLFLAADGNDASSDAVQQVTPAAPMASASIDSLLDSLLDFHADPPTAVATDRASVERFAPDIGVRVHVPDFRQYGGLWQGGSIVPIRSQRVVHLRYRMAERNVTLYVYNSARVPVHRRLELRTVRERPIYVGQRRGYYIAVTENNGIGYAIATDLSDRETAELVASIH